MKSILMMMTLLATATAVSAQTPPPGLPQPGYTRQSPQYFPPSLPYPLESLEAAAQTSSDCPFARALQEANVAWQRLRAMCGSAKTASCCEMSNACKGAGCAAGIAGCAKGSEAAQPPKACCCAKACACCETCKAAKTQEIVQVEQVPMPMACPFALPPMTGWKMQCGPGSVQIVAQPMCVPPMCAPPMCAPPIAGPYGVPIPMMGQAMPHVAYMAVNLGARPAKLVTPDFEAHCDHMIQKGNTIELVGNVMLLCKKYAQPLRIEGQRIVVNLTDGSFVVEAGATQPRITVPAIGVSMNRIESVPGMTIQRYAVAASAPRAQPMPERCQQVIHLRNAPAAEVAKAINKFIQFLDNAPRTNSCEPMKSEVTVVADPISNAVIISTTPCYLDTVVKIIGQLDKNAQPVSECVRPGTLAPASGVIEVVPVPRSPATGPRPR